MDHIHKSIETLTERVRQQEAELQKTKNAVNALRAVLDLPPLYSDPEPQGTVMIGKLRGDEFYGQPLSTVVRTILEARREAGAGAATINDIYAAMVEGGFAFDTANEENAKRGLRTSLSKNSQTFHKLPNGKYGLRDWYPAVKERVKAGTDAVAKDEGGGSPSPEGEEGEDLFDFEAREKRLDKEQGEKAAP
jgi:hypothetical protein